jgi:hypothetical protein
MNIIFYNDSLVYGGHEATTVNFIKYLVKKNSFNIYVYYNKQNIRFYNQVSLIKGIQIIELPYQLSRFLKIFDLINPFKLYYLYKKFKLQTPDVVIGVQGTIEFSILGNWIAKLMRIKNISYIPMTDNFTSQNNTILNKLKDIFYGIYYKIPDNFFTISKSEVINLKSRGINEKNIGFGYCGVNEDELSKINLIKNKTSKIKIAIIGRIEFKQKNQDYLIKFLNEYKSSFKDKFEFLVIGDGPDRQELQLLINDSKLNSLVTILSWESDIQRLYSIFDVLLITSNFEGIPLVIYESLYFKKTIITPNINGINEILDESCFYDKKSYNSLFFKIVNHKDIITDSQVHYYQEFNEAFYNFIQ